MSLVATITFSRNFASSTLIFSMNKYFNFISSLTLAALLSGCVGTGPNTQQGAVTGGTLGAIAGAIIGNNSRGGNAVGGALLGGAIGAIAGGTIGNSVDHQNGTLYGSQQQAYQSRVHAEMAPPPTPALPTTPEVVTVSPSPNAIWIPGYWSFGGRSYIWFAGHWEMPPPNVRTYITAHWERQGRHYFWVPSYWQ